MGFKDICPTWTWTWFERQHRKPFCFKIQESIHKIGSEVFLQGPVPIYQARLSLSYAPHISEVYNNIGLNRALKVGCKYRMLFFGSQENFLLQKYSVSNFSIYTVVVVVIVVAVMAILVVVFLFHHCWCYVVFQFLLSPLLISIKKKNIVERGRLR